MFKNLLYQCCPRRGVSSGQRSGEQLLGGSAVPLIFSLFLVNIASEVSGQDKRLKPKIIYVPSAFKHGVNRENICHVLAWPEYEGPLEDDGDKHLVIGFDLNGNLLEILYNQTGDGIAKVFHAMKCRSIFYPLLNH
jgi:hypothetical protein